MNTIGNLIDQLTIVNMKIWACEDMKRDADDDKTVANATRKTNILNPQRNDLIAEIDEKLNHMVKTGELQKLYGQGETKIYGRK